MIKCVFQYIFLQFLKSVDSVPPLLWRFPKSWNPYNVKSFLTDISLSVAQIKKFQKTRWFYFLILLLGGPSQPTKMYMKA